MRQTQIKALVRVTEAAFQKEFQAIRPLVEAETLVLRKLRKLDTQVKAARHDSAQSQGYKITGTDILWNGWEAATRRQLNMELARIRVQKLSALDALRLSFGRKRAVESLSESLLADQFCNQSKGF